MSPEDIEALIRLLDDPRLGQMAEAQLVHAGAAAVPSLRAYADLAPTVANEILKKIHATDHEVAWAQLARSPDVEAGAFLLAECLDPFIDRHRTKIQLDDLAHPLRGALPTGSIYTQRDALALRDWLSYAKRFRANKNEYYAPDNLLLPQVVESRLGVPLTLCLIYLLIGRRLGAPVYMIELPHHPVVRYGDPDKGVYIDPYHDGVLMNEKECRAAARQAGAIVHESAFLPMSDYDMIERLLRALAAVYTQRRDSARQQQIERYRKIWRDAPATSEA
jgi:regulator of sirC expression with transglutaminase-like and TPR domain